MMGFERFIARRYLLSKRKARFISIITLISVVGITVGVAALIIVLSVFNGFNSLVTDILVGFDPHIRIEPARGSVLQDYEDVASIIEFDNRIEAYSPVISGRAIMVVSNLNRIVNIRGMEQTRIADVSGVDESIVLGSLLLDRPDGSDGIVLGIGLADRLNAMMGDTVTVISPQGMEAALLRFGQPVLRRYIVSGIYESMNQDYDANYAFVSLQSARRLYPTGEGVTGVELRLYNFRLSENVKRDLQNKLGNDYLVSTWYDLHRDLYSVMEIERWAAYIILSLIIAVATFNILGSLTMSVIEKTRDIGVLKTLGATRREVVRIYLFEGILVGLIGSMLGSIIGYIVCYLQIQYHLFPLDPTIYIIPALPVEIRMLDFFAVGGAALLLSSLAALYPARRAANVLPAQAVRWE
jgi:lipoprotein-releasing system permease protein